ncbi:MAG: hypothetical protein JST16_11020 [Bdellovibrionales bacterium]|nr:hypothetical protein [Bdellovibrionales bacterium]
MNKFTALSLLAVTLSLSACDGENHLKATRTAETPMIVEYTDLPVTVYRLEGAVRQDPRCGVDVINNTVIYRTCYVEDMYEDRKEKVSVRVHFPQGSELSGSQQEQIEAEFSNDAHHPELDYGYAEATIKSSVHKYDKASLKNIQLYYGRMNDVYVKLK